MDRIFVKIASYRDAELPKTIRSALSNAKHPERITFGICWQYDELTYLDLDPFVSSPNFRIYQTYYENSKGCCWARHETDNLYEGEEYMLQIDAHMRFSKDWDERFIIMLESLDVQKPVLSTYPAPFEYVDGVETLLTNRGVQRLTLKHMYRNLTTKFTTKLVEDPEILWPSKFIGAGQVFAHGHFCEEVKYDPELYFSGEEISLSARAYTHGYDVYCPNEDLLWHYYQHSMPLHTADHRDNQHQSAVARLTTLFLEDHTSLSEFGLGSARTLEQYEDFAELNFSQCANREWEKTHLKMELPLDLSNIEERDDYDYWIFTLRNIDDEELYRKDLSGDEIPNRETPLLNLDVELDDKPAMYVLWPHTTSEGYLNRIVQEYEFI